MLLFENINAIPQEQNYSLVRASLDLGRVLADRDGVTFRSQGTCMYPAIRPGDVLRIQSRPAVDVSVGEIAVCRRPGYLFSHRVIAKGDSDGRTFIVTRPDRSQAGSDTPTFDEDLLGVVVRITRNGREIALNPKAYPWFANVYFAARLGVFEAWPSAQMGLTKILGYLQGSSLYESLVRKWLKFRKPVMTYSVKVPLNATLGATVYRLFKAEEFNPKTSWPNHPVESWILSLQLNSEPEPAAWVRFVCNPEPAWRVEESFVRIRYRGAGFPDNILREAEKLLTRSENA